MTSVAIERVCPQKKPHAIFISAGDRETFASLALDALTDTFDILIFFYGTSAEKREALSRDATVFAAGAGGKFPALQEIYRQNRQLLLRYQTIWACDDDVQPEFGNVRTLPALSVAFGIKVLSPAHSRRGRISHEFMVPKLGRHLFRYVNFVETTCPLFATAELAKFLEAYGGTHGGYGDDWWFLNILEADKSAVAAIVDGVTIVNPEHSRKPGGDREIDRLGGLGERIARWEDAMPRYNLHEFKQRNLAFVFLNKAGMASLWPNAGLFQREAASLVHSSLIELRLRFHRLRKRLAKRFTWG